ncbi:zinc finger MYM-type protein 1-like [Aphis craccivora]|uniref:Zinc finger MYM-type protein 1-like n=1 Tax=Aphis craccivora TaxID=307492 RepID=A0A6G0WMY8_APHCR|nr:zinc finger MYM-type protein 1-like [Aphis craccivora]
MKDYNLLSEKYLNSAAIYTWCYAHRLSLVVVEMSSCSANAVDTFGNLEQLYSLTSTNPEIKIFQSQDIDLLGAVNSLRAISSSLKVLRSDDRSRKKMLLFGETTENNTLIDLKLQFKIKTYLIAINSAISCIEDRFHSKSQELLKDISLFSVSLLKKTKSDPNTLPDNAFNKFFLEQIMMKKTSDFVDSDDQEVKENTVGLNKKNNQNLGTLLHVCHNSGLQSVFPTLYFALQIACTLPVSSTTPERTFSKLKIVKNRLRTTISQDRLEQLMIISCESDIDMDYNQN